MSALVIALALGQNFPYLAPILVPSTIPGLVPSVNATNTSQPLIIPAILPTSNPGYTPGIFTPQQIPTLIGANAALIVGSCTSLCVGTSTNSSTLGLVALQCIACGQVAARQTSAFPAAYCQNQLTQAACNTCYSAILCSNILGLSSGLLSALSSGATCFCAATATFGCPSCGGSKKGLLGLLGLLGLIPLLLLCLLLLLCCLRRRKRQQDVHFATFDPAAANLAVPMPCPGVPPPPY